MYRFFTKIFCHIDKVMVIDFWQSESASVGLLSALPLLSHLKKTLHLKTSNHMLNEVCKWHLTKTAK